MLDLLMYQIYYTNIYNNFIDYKWNKKAINFSKKTFIFIYSGNNFLSNGIENKFLIYNSL